MKKLFHIFLFLLILRGLPITALAQTTNLSELSDRQIAEGLIKGTIDYSAVPFERNSGIYEQYRYLLYDTKNKLSFYDGYTQAWAEKFLSSEPGYVEVENNGDILTWPIAFKYIARKDLEFVLYTDKIKPNNAYATYSTVFGKQYPTEQTKMNMMKIGNKTRPIMDVLTGIDLHNALVINAKQLVRPKDGNDLLLSYSVTYSEKPKEVIYTAPTYIAMAGQLLQVDNGVHYEVSLHDIGYLSLISPETMSCKYTIALEGIDNPIVYRCFGRGFTHYFCGNNAYYKNTRVFSKDGTPIYIISGDCQEIITKLIPGDGDIVYDMAETEDYIIYCGSNTKHGYVGFDNPILVVIDKKTNKEIARYNSSLDSKRKGVRFSKLILVPFRSGMRIYLDTQGAKKEQYGRLVGTEYTEVVSLSSLLNK